MNRPNIVWICTDQQRPDSLGCYGNPIVRSPHIDSIARAGARFNRHLTPMQICSPSRATMVTGLYPRNHQLATNGMALPESRPTLMTRLAGAGYRTHGVGKQHLQPLLAPAEMNMPDSRAFWTKPESVDWVGPYYGYQTLDLLLGESDTAHLAGHYASWLAREFPGLGARLEPAAASVAPPADLDEVWRSAMPVEQHYNTWISDRAGRFVEQNRGKERPFFLFVSYPDPHHPFDPPEPYADRYDPGVMPLPVVTEADRAGRPPYCTRLYPQGAGFRESYWAGDEGVEAGATITTDDISDESLQRAIAYTYAMIEMLDAGVGQILGTLNDNGFADNTIVIFTSDHGEYLGSHGLLHKGPASYRQLTEVSMLISGPDVQSGRVIESLTSHIDLMPTLLAMTATDSADLVFDGLDLTPLLQGREQSIREYVFGEYHPTVKPELYNQTIYFERWRYTIYPALPEWGELFDLDDDPGECANRFFEPALDGVKRQLGEVLAGQFPPQPEVENKTLCKW